jgi:hypothetical protein
MGTAMANRQSGGSNPPPAEKTAPTEGSDSNNGGAAAAGSQTPQAPPSTPSAGDSGSGATPAAGAAGSGGDSGSNAPSLMAMTLQRSARVIVSRVVKIKFFCAKLFFSDHACIHLLCLQDEDPSGLADDDVENNAPLARRGTDTVRSFVLVFFPSRVQ